MRFANAATFFDRDKCFDAYTGAYLFNAQMASFDGRELDGSFVRRRTVSFAPDTVPPPRQVVTVLGEGWVLGGAVTDGHRGEAVRKTLSARLVTGDYNLLTPGQAARGTPATRVAKGYLRYLKGASDTPGVSELEPYFELSLGISEKGLDGRIVEKDGTYYSVKLAYESSEGFSMAELDQISGDDYQNGKVQVETEGKVNPVTEVREPGAVISGLLMDRFQLYQRTGAGEAKNEPGDKSLIIAGMDSQLIKSKVKINGQDWIVLESHEYYDARVYHIRPS